MPCTFIQVTHRAKSARHPPVSQILQIIVINNIYVFGRAHRALQLCSLRLYPIEAQTPPNRPQSLGRFGGVWDSIGYRRNEQKWIAR